MSIQIRSFFQHGLSRFIGYLAHWRAGVLKNAFIVFFVKHYGVNVGEIDSFDPVRYPSFNVFFTRALKSGVRPMAQEAGAVVSPADGVISEIGYLDEGRLLQAKGRSYELHDLLAGDVDLVEAFVRGSFLTIYLAPKDYHRVHMPVGGKLQHMIHVPGSLYSVGPATVNSIPNLFARNERVISIFETEQGPLAVILVGATCVGSIETLWHGVVTPPTGRVLQHWEYGQEGIELQRGDEMGRFNMGSTVILLFASGAVRWLDSLKANDSLKMGCMVGAQNL